jgi:cbb3-type cytochrome oxidase maturation protein
MSAIIILIGFSLLVALGFLAAFLFSARKGQFDDTYTPSVRMLFDDEVQPESEEDITSANSNQA